MNRVLSPIRICPTQSPELIGRGGRVWTNSADISAMAQGRIDCMQGRVEVTSELVLSLGYSNRNEHHIRHQRLGRSLHMELCDNYARGREEPESQPIPT